MKRPSEDDAPAPADVRAAVAATFKPEQKRRAGDICKNASDCAGYIEGKVYDKGAASEDSWEFLLTVELGSRAYVGCWTFPRCINNFVIDMCITALLASRHHWASSSGPQ